MKPIRFLGDSLSRLREFDADAKQDAGYQLDKVQRGEQPDDFNPCLQSVRELKRLEFGMSRELIESFIQQGLQMQYMFYMRFRRKRKPRQNVILILQKYVLLN
ncbi:hypothetical protein PGH45_12880 [Legionella pneumophila]|nr:hypothetical protein [Legionella pneumophila]MDF1930780.1 hypothetical protein [Legionella pneumophila]